MLLSDQDDDVDSGEPQMRTDGGSGKRQQCNNLAVKRKRRRKHNNSSLVPNITKTCMMEAARSRSWSDLQPELLGLVLRRLPSLADRVRLRAVCRPWRSNSMLSPLPLPFPWLTLPDGTFLSIPAGEIHRIPVPDGASVQGSIDNWLFLMHKSSLHSDSAFSLMNPFSKNMLELPDLVAVWKREIRDHSHRKPRFYKLVVPSPLDSSPDSPVAALITDDGNCHTLCISQPPIATASSGGAWNKLQGGRKSKYEGLGGQKTKKNLPKPLPKKNSFTVWSKPGGAVAPSDLHVAMPLTASLGDNKDPRLNLSDVVFFNEKLFALGNFGSLHIIDFGSNDLGISSSECIIESLGDIGGTPQHLSTTCIVKEYLVECGGKLLMVVRWLNLMLTPCRTSCDISTAAFQVFEADLSTSPGQWKRANELGGHSLFVGEHGSKSLPAVECTGYHLEDCIYFICDYYTLPTISANPLGDSGVYNIRNGTITQLMSGTAAAAPLHRVGQWRPTWFFPPEAV